VFVAGLMMATSHARAQLPQRQQEISPVDSLVFHQLEVRPADTIAQLGRVPVSVAGSGDRLYLHPDVLATHFDVQRATVIARDGGAAVEVEFSAAAAQRLAEGTQAHLGRPLAIMLDGQVVAAPVIGVPIAGTLVIPTTTTRVEAERIAAGLAPRSGVVRPRAAVRIYPSEAQSVGVEGIVAMRVVVNADGSVGDVIVTTSLDRRYGIDEAAVDAVKGWKFTPATKDGMAVPAELTIFFEFTSA
jgi:TonB family protein